MIWSLYSQKSSGNKGTLYQLRTIRDRRNVVADPKKDFNACHDFLQTVIDGHVVAAACTTFDVSQPQHITKHMTLLFPKGVPDVKDHTSALKAIEAVAMVIEEKYTNYTPSTVAATDGVLNYRRSLLSMGLLARNFEDSWKEGDGPRSIRLWKYLLLHFKQSGHTKYAYEAFRLLAAINVTLTPKRSYELMWNRVCSNRNGAGHNIPLDLKMEQLNRIFKDDLKTAHSHMTDNVIHKTANAAGTVDRICSEFDEHFQVRSEVGDRTMPDKCDDVNLVAKTLINAREFKELPNRKHSQYPCVQKDPFTGH